MAGKEKIDKTVGEALIEQNKTVIKLLELLAKQNEEKLEKAEVIANLLSNIGRNQEQAKVAPNVQLPNLDSLPWRKYAKGPGSWIFADMRGAEKLYDLIKESQANEVPIDSFKYKISRGRDKEFITRTPV